MGHGGSVRLEPATAFRPTTTSGRKGVVPMVISSRVIVTMGLCTVGLGLLVGHSLGQQPDGGVRRTASNSAATPKPKPAVPPVIGTIDLDSVFKNYEKVKVSSEEFKAAALAKK